ncbi:DUF2544 domain-containing protein [Citrobacter freundii]|nr:DUF2544 domain-containing protein [Citrobacter freundii]
MMMKKIHCLSVLVLAIVGVLFSSSALAQGKLRSSQFETTVYWAASNVGTTDVRYDITVSTPTGVYYGVYESRILVLNREIPNVSWTGPSSTAPTLYLKSWDTVSNSKCPGMDTSGNYWKCAKQVLRITLQSDDYGCPWVASTSITSKAFSAGDDYYGPPARNTICPTVPVDTYDVSWDANSLKHEKVLKITPTGGTVSTTLKTYLMESGTLCDKSKMDTRGAGCRVVGSGVTLSVLGCDNSVVSTVALTHALTDTELHDITVSVNTKNIGTGTVKSTCNFQYILEQL